jgi:AhpD family alkylhydroperoxidase
VLAESPQALAAYQALSDQFMSSSLSETAKLVVLLAASRQNGCSYCVAAYSALGSAQNVDDSVIGALRHGKPIDDAELEAVRRFTIQVVDHRGWVSGDDVQAFLDAGFTRRQVLDVLTGVAMKTLSNYTNHLANTPLDDAFASYAWTPDS